MALIKCKECGHDVSDKASVCPNCGCPIEKGTNHVSNKPVKNSKTKSWFLLALLFCLIMGGGYYAFNNLFNGGNGKDAIVKLTPKFANAIQKYEKLGSFSEGLAAVMRDGKWGYINTKGDEVIECQYERVGNFSEGLAFVYKSDDESFSVINTNGKETFKGKCGFSYFLGSGVPDEVWDDILPYYKNGKLFVPYGEKYVVYDNKGNNISEVDIETDLDSQNKQALPYIIFAKENGDDNFQYNTVGLKDDNGAELIPAIYDGIGNVGLGERIDASNGVLLVVLDEIGEDVIEGYGGGFDSPDTKHHYGYVDLKGNDTFSNELKERCQNSKERAIQKLIEEKKTRFIGVFQFTDDQNLKWTLTLNKDKTAVLYLKFEKVSFGQEGLTHYGSWIEGTSYVLISFDEHTKVGFPSLRNYVTQMSMDKEGNYLYPSDMARSKNPETRLPLNKIN